MKYFKYPLENNANPQRHSIQGPSLAVPVFLLLQNMEEAPFMERWSKRLPLKIHPTVITRQFVVAVTFLTKGGFSLTYASLEWLPASTGYLLILGMQAILFVNAFIRILLQRSDSGYIVPVLGRQCSSPSLFRFTCSNARLQNRS
jgi:hypothetical protein